MARIAGVEIPAKKRMEIALTYIFGVGRTISNRILYEAKIDPNKRAKDLTESEIGSLQSIIQRDYKVEGDLRRSVRENVKRLIDISSYRGLRHRRNLPVRGQRTKTNARTKRGRRRTVGSVTRDAKETAAKA